MSTKSLACCSASEYNLGVAPQYSSDQDDIVIIDVYTDLYLRFIKLAPQPVIATTRIIICLVRVEQFPSQHQQMLCSAITTGLSRQAAQVKAVCIVIPS